jgi:hypothetical protein
MTHDNPDGLGADIEPSDDFSVLGHLHKQGKKIRLIKS